MLQPHSHCRKKQWSFTMACLSSRVGVRHWQWIFQHINVKFTWDMLWLSSSRAAFRTAYRFCIQQRILCCTACSGAATNNYFVIDYWSDDCLVYKMSINCGKCLSSFLRAQRPKDFSFTIINVKEKQVFDILAWKMTDRLLIKTVVINLFFFFNLFINWLLQL